MSVWVTWALVAVAAGAALGLVIVKVCDASRRRTARRARHNDLDYACEYWWGDRPGSLSARCPICNPK